MAQLSLTRALPPTSASCSLGPGPRSTRRLIVAVRCQVARADGSGHVPPCKGPLDPHALRGATLLLAAALTAQAAQPAAAAARGLPWEPRRHYRRLPRIEADVEVGHSISWPPACRCSACWRQLIIGDHPLSLQGCSLTPFPFVPLSRRRWKMRSRRQSFSSRLRVSSRRLAAFSPRCAPAGVQLRDTQMIRSHLAQRTAHKVSPQQQRLFGTYIATLAPAICFIIFGPSPRPCTAVHRDAAVGGVGRERSAGEGAHRGGDRQQRPALRDRRRRRGEQ